PGLETVADPQALSHRLADWNAPVGFVVVPALHSPLSLGEARVRAGTPNPSAGTTTMNNQSLHALSSFESGSREGVSARDRVILAAPLTPSGHRPLLIVVPDRRHLTRLEHVPGGAPDIVVFDESFVNRDVPFGAFAAMRRLYRLWTRRGMTTF